MKTMRNRFLAVLLSVTILMNMVPLNQGAFAAGKEKKTADICFVLDTTGSMRSYIDRVIRSLEKFVERLDSEQIDYRLALLEFKDVTYDTRPLHTHTIDGNIWTNNAAEYIKVLKKVQVDGGGDGPETPSNALDQAYLPAGRGGNTKRFVFLLTDADFKNHDSTSNQKVEDMGVVIKQLQNNDTCVSVVSKGYLKERYRNLYDGTNGIFIDIDQNDYTDMMMQIADWISINALEVISGEFEYNSFFSSTEDAKATYYYSDSYFFESSEYYNNHLATMSICLALSVNSTMGKSVKELEDYEWANRTKNAKKLLEEIGFEDFEQTKDSEGRPDINTIGAVIAHKTLNFKKRSGEEDPTTLIAIAVRGTGYLDEWGGNFYLESKGRPEDVNATNFHEGFSIAREKVLKLLRTYITRHDIKGKIKLWITGYSRAGATANMVAGKLDYQMDNGVLIGREWDCPLPAGVTLAHSDLYAYPLEPPMGVPTELAKVRKTDESNIHNVVNVYDPVPKLAIKQWGFTRHNKEGSSSHTLPGMLPNTSSVEYEKAVKKWREQYWQIQDGAPTRQEKVDSLPYREGVTIPVPKVEVQIYKPELRWWEKALLLNPFKGAITYGIIAGDQIGQTIANSKIGITFENKNIGLTNIAFEGFLSEIALTTPLNEMKKVYQTPIVKGLQEMLGYRYDSDFGAYGKNTLKIFTTLFNICVEYIGENLYYLLLVALDTAISQTLKISRLTDILKEWARTKSFKQRIIDKFADEGITLNNTMEAEHLLMMAESVLIVLGKLLALDPAALWIGGAAPLVVGNAGSAHIPEVTMAWLRSQDSFYTDKPVNVLFPNIYRIIRINCPVDVKVKENGETVAAIQNDKASSDKEYVSCYINENDEKILVLPADDTFDIEITPTGDGEMSFSIDENNLIYEDCPRIINYYNIPITTGQKIYATIPAIDPSEYADAHRASTADYRLAYSDGRQITPDRDDKNPSEMNEYTVTAYSDFPGGLVNGGGTFTEGSFAKMEAVPYTEDGFQGWYKDGKLLSTEKIYRFPVTGDTRLEARFKKVPTSHVKVVSDGNGAVYGWDQDYPVGTILDMKADPFDDYKFLYWEIQDANGAYSSELENGVYVVGEKDANIVGRFGRTYTFLYGSGSTWAKGSDTTLNFVVNSSKSNLSQVLIDGKPISQTDYTASEPNLSIALNTSLLSGLSVGSHEISVHLKDGLAKTTFYIVDSIPQTGDNGNIEIWIITAGTCVILLAVLFGIFFRRRRTGTRK